MMEVYLSPQMNPNGTMMESGAATQQKTGASMQAFASNSQERSQQSRECCADILSQPQQQQGEQSYLQQQQVQVPEGAWGASFVVPQSAIIGAARAPNELPSRAASESDATGRLTLLDSSFEQIVDLHPSASFKVSASTAPKQRAPVAEGALLQQGAERAPFPFDHQPIPLVSLELGKCINMMEDILLGSPALHQTSSATSEAHQQSLDTTAGASRLAPTNRRNHLRDMAIPSPRGVQGSIVTNKTVCLCDGLKDKKYQLVPSNGKFDKLETQPGLSFPTKSTETTSEPSIQSHPVSPLLSSMPSAPCKRDRQDEEVDPFMLTQSPTRWVSATPSEKGARGSPTNSLLETFPPSRIHQICALCPQSLSVVSRFVQEDPEGVARRAPRTRKSFLKKRKVNECDYPINIALHHGASLPALTLLASAGSEVLVDGDGPEWGSALSCALREKRDLGVVSALLKANRAQIRVSDRHLSYPLHIACMSGASLPVIKLLASRCRRALERKSSRSQAPCDIATRSPHCSDEVVDYLQSVSFDSLEEKAIHMEGLSVA